MARKDYIIGIDAGTSGIKALAFSFKGEMIRTEKRQLEVLPSDKGWMEHDAELIFRMALFLYNGSDHLDGLQAACHRILYFHAQHHACGQKGESPGKPPALE